MAYRTMSSKGLALTVTVNYESVLLAEPDTGVTTEVQLESCGTSGE